MLNNKPDILTVLEREGLETRRRGRDHWAHCPFHADKHPSFKVNAERQFWFCFGCSEGGDSIDFIMKLHNLSFKDACSYLGITPGRPVQPDLEVTRRREIQQAYDRAISKLYYSLCDRSQHIYRIQRQVQENTGSLTPLGAVYFAKTLGELAEVEHWLDVLLTGEFEQKIDLLKEQQHEKNTNERAA